MIRPNECTEERFLASVATHKMTVEHDEGVFRCLRFAKPGEAYNMHFTLTTWAGYLAISGDMGCFVFTRLRDMFEFFRQRDPSETSKLHINPSYWGEKCEAADRRTGGTVEFDADRFKECVKQHFDEHYEDNPESEEAKDCWRELEWNVLDAENNAEAHRKAYEFEHEGFKLSDFWEHDTTRYTYHFIWCLYAIAWGIQQYDAANVTAVPATV